MNPLKERKKSHEYSKTCSTSGVLMSKNSVLLQLSINSVLKMIAVFIFLTLSLSTYFLWDYFNSKRRRELLSKIPSPKSIPFINHTAHFVNKIPEDILKTLTKFSEELGSIWYFTIPGSTNIMVSDPKVAEVILSSQKIIEKSSDYDLIVPWLGTGLLISGGKKWHQRRKIITPAFHFKILEQFVDVMESQGQILVKKLKKFDGMEVDVFPHVSLYAMDVICGNYNKLIASKIE